MSVDLADTQRRIERVLARLPEDAARHADVRIPLDGREPRVTLYDVSAFRWLRGVAADDSEPKWYGGPPQANAEAEVDGIRWRAVALRDDLAGVYIDRAATAPEPEPGPAEPTSDGLRERGVRFIDMHFAGWAVDPALLARSRKEAPEHWAAESERRAADEARKAEAVAEAERARFGVPRSLGTPVPCAECQGPIEAERVAKGLTFCSKVSCLPF